MKALYVYDFFVSLLVLVSNAEGSTGTHQYVGDIFTLFYLEFSKIGKKLGKN